MESKHERGRTHFEHLRHGLDADPVLEPRVLHSLGEEVDRSLKSLLKRVVIGSLLLVGVGRDTPDKKTEPLKVPRLAGLEKSEKVLAVPNGVENDERIGRSGSAEVGGGRREPERST